MGSSYLSILETFHKVQLASEDRKSRGIGSIDNIAFTQVVPSGLVKKAIRQVAPTILKQIPRYCSTLTSSKHDRRFTLRNGFTTRGVWWTKPEHKQWVSRINRERRELRSGQHSSHKQKGRRLEIGSERAAKTVPKCNQPTTN